MSWELSISPETGPYFNDPYIHTCPIDGQTFDDAGVYQQHMLMYHGLNVPVIENNQTVIEAPFRPVVPPPDPYFIPAPGVTLTPIGGGNYTPVYTPPKEVPTFTPYTPPYVPTPIKPQPVVINPVPVNGNGSGSGSGSGGSVAGWAFAGIIGAMVLFGATRKRSRTRTK